MSEPGCGRSPAPRRSSSGACRSGAPRSAAASTGRSRRSRARAGRWRSGIADQRVDLAATGRAAAAPARPAQPFEPLLAVDVHQRGLDRGAVAEVDDPTLRPPAGSGTGPVAQRLRAGDGTHRRRRGGRLAPGAGRPPDGAVAGSASSHRSPATARQAASVQLRRAACRARAAEPLVQRRGLGGALGVTLGVGQGVTSTWARTPGSDHRCSIFSAAVHRAPRGVTGWPWSARACPALQCTCC